MTRLVNVPPEKMSEVVRLASDLYEKEKAQTQERQSTIAAAQEMGIPVEYLERAAAQLDTRPKPRRRALGIVTSIGVLFVLLIGWIHLRPMEGGAPSGASVSINNQIIGASDLASGAYTFYLSPSHIMPDGGAKNVSIRVQSHDVGPFRLILLSGNQRWLSPPLTASSHWGQQTLSLDSFKYQTRTQTTAPWEPKTFVTPTNVNEISFDLGAAEKDTIHQGQVDIDDLQFGSS